MRKTFVITISGSGGDAGKTLLAQKLLPCLPNCAAVKVQTHGAELAVAIEDDPEQSPGKDTSRYLIAGARRAYLLHGPSDLTRPVVADIVAGGAYDNVLIESNSMARDLPGDLHYYVQGPDAEKPGASCRERADIVVSAISHHFKEDKPMTTDQSQSIKEAMQEASKEGRIACKDALAIAKRLGVDSRQMSKIANELKIKIKGCQLGCF